MSQQNINQYVYKKWFITNSKPIFDISLASDERDYNEEVVFSNQLIGVNDGNRLPIHFDLNNSGSSQMMTINYQIIKKIRLNNNKIYQIIIQ